MNYLKVKIEEISFPIHISFYKFCQILGYNEFLPKLKLYKDRLKLYEHDKIWKKICEHLGGENAGWKFIKS